jgi:3-oxoacyl-[acyl-carrier-protein] synthase II
MGVVSSIGIGCDRYFESLLDRRSGITSLANRTDGGPKPDTMKEPPGLWIGGPILDFDAKQYVKPRKALKVMCREIQTAFAASQIAIDSAGLGDQLPASVDGTLDPSRAGAVFGSEMFFGPPSEMEDTMRACFREDGSFDPSRFGSVAMKQIMPLWMLKYLPNMPACHVGIALNARGPNNSVLMGDISSLAATIEAISYIERGLADLVITGGTGTRISTTRLNYRGDLPIPDVSEPIEMSSRPHDPTSKGVVSGEGAASLVLESASSAGQRGIEPIVRIVSYANRFVPSQGMRRPLRSSDVNDRQVRGSAPSIRLAIETALEDAEISAMQVGLVVSHGTGDPSCDAAEREAIEAVGLTTAPLVATVASLGHTGAGCGAIDLVTGALALAKGVAPPTLHHDDVIPQANFLREPAALRGDHVLCLSHNSEGNAIAMLLGRA